MRNASATDINLARIGSRLLIVTLLGAVIWWLRPLFHPVIYGIAYSPSTIYVVGIPLLTGLLLYLLPPFNVTKEDVSSRDAKTALFSLSVIAGVFLALTLGNLGGTFEDRHLATEAMEQATAEAEFPRANEENPRIVPQAVADIQTRGSVSYRQHQLGISDIARMEDGRLAWSYPIQPDQFRNRLQGNQRGVLLSDMTAMEDREMRAFDEHPFTYGQNMILHRSADWQLKKSDFWVQYRDDPIEFTHDGEAYMAFPKTGHEWHLLPIPHTTPTWEGVALVHQDGTIEHFTPNEARASDILDGQRLFPLYNASRYAESLQYRGGILNVMPAIGTYEGVVEPAALPAGAGNSQPFVIDLQGERMSYVYAMEPAGLDTRGLDEVWFFDSHTGEMRFFETGTETLLGPERAMGIVRAEDTRTDWDTERSSGEFSVVEPIPTVVDGDLWWHAKVVPTDNTDVTRNAFVNAHSGTVVEIRETAAVVDFLSGEDADDISDVEVVAAEDDIEEDAPAYYIIISEDGEEVDRIGVDDVEDIGIEVEAQ